MPSLSIRATAALLARISFGLSLVCVGLVHYMQFTSFSLVVSDGLGPLEPLGMAWAYLMPAFMILGGALFALGLGVEVAVWLIGIALGSIAPGMLLKSIITTIDLTDMMAAANNAFMWLAMFLLITMSLKGSGLEALATVEDVPDTKPAKPVPAKTAAAAPVATKPAAPVAKVAAPVPSALAKAREELAKKKAAKKK